MIPIVDTHTHFWNPERLHYPWLGNVPSLQKTFGVEDYQRATSAIPIEKMVIVECNCLPEQARDEVIWAKELARIDPRIKGMVAYAHLTDTEEIDAVLDEYAADPFIRGIRHNIQWNPKGFALQPAFIEGIHKVSRKGFHFELCITCDQLEEVLELVRQCGEVSLVLDHCGKPAIKRGEVEPWKSQIQRLARFSNVHCKISGLLTESDVKNWSDDQLKVYASHIADCFGTHRIMFGSDWPVLELAGKYQDWYDFTLHLTEGWGESEKRSFYHDNAVYFYGLSNPHGIPSCLTSPTKPRS